MSSIENRYSCVNAQTLNQNSTEKSYNLCSSTLICLRAFSYLSLREVYRASRVNFTVYLTTDEQKSLFKLAKKFFKEFLSENTILEEAVVQIQENIINMLRQESPGLSETTVKGLKTFWNTLTNVQGIKKHLTILKDSERKWLLRKLVKNEFIFDALDKTIDQLADHLALSRQIIANYPKHLAAYQRDPMDPEIQNIFPEGEGYVPFVNFIIEFTKLQDWDLVVDEILKFPSEHNDGSYDDTMILCFDYLMDAYVEKRGIQQAEQFVKSVVDKISSMTPADKSLRSYIYSSLSRVAWEKDFPIYANALIGEVAFNDEYINEWGVEEHETDLEAALDNHAKAHGGQHIQKWVAFLIQNIPESTDVARKELICKGLEKIASRVRKANPYVSMR